MRRRFLTLASLIVLPAFALAEDKPAADPAENHEGGQIERLDQFTDFASDKPSEAATKWAAGFKERNPNGFKRWDTDGDGTLSTAEAKAAIAKLSAMLKEKHPELFKSIDTDGDGAISREEAKAARAKWASEHANENKPKGDAPPAK